MGSKGATTTSTMQPPKEVADMYKYLTEQGKALQQQPYQPYTGQMVAELNPVQQQGIQQAQQYSQAAQPYYQGAAAGTLGAMQGYTPQGFQQGVAGYMSPYIQNSLDLLANQQAQQRQELLGKTIASGAFGGDRGKIAQAALMGQQNLATGQLLQQGYQDAAKNYMAGLGAQGALSAQLGTLGTGAQTAGLQGAQAVAQAGATPYQVEQAKLASQYGQFAQGQAYPFQTLGYLANIASGLGAGQGGTSSTTQPGPNVLGQAFGTALSLASLPWSDKRLKEDIEEVGKTFDGQPIYSFKYKGDDKTQIGLMAQDVEKKHPEAVGLAGGYKTVDYAKATEDAAERGKFYLGGASMGGLVPSGQERQAYATKGAVGATPYLDDPLYALLAEYLKVPMASVVPQITLEQGHSGIPDAPKPYEDKEMDISKGLQAMTGSQKASIASNIGRLFGSGISARDPYYAYGAGGYEGFGPFTTSYSTGGLVPREHHADGERAGSEAGITVPLADVPYGSDKPTIFEHVTGMNLSPDARAGMLAAGLGMMASRSPYFGTAVGEGGLAGLNTYYNAIKNKYDVQKELAKLGLEKQRIDIDRLTAGTNAYEKVRQLYTVKQDENGNIHAYTMSGQEIPITEYYKDMSEAARLLGLPVDRLIARHQNEQPRASGGRTGHALGGSEEGDKSGLAAASLPAPDQVQPTAGPDLGIRDMVRSAMEQPEMKLDAAKPVQMAQSAATTQSDVSQGVATEKLHPTLQRIIGLNEKSKKLYQEADQINEKISKALLMDEGQRNVLKDKASNLRNQALQYETQANDLMKLEQVDPSGIRYRWEYGAEEPENMPPKGITPETKRGEIDPNTGRMMTAPVDLGYSQTGGLPTVKLGKHQVRIGEDPLSAEATKSSQELLKDFQDRTSAVQDGILNTVKFAAALKVLQSGALTGDATSLAAIAKDLGFDSIANELSLGKNIEAAEIALKTQVDNAIAKSTASFARPTQIEFGKIEEGATPSRNSQPGAAHSVAQTTLAGLLSQQALMRDWGNAQANGARNFAAYQNYWRQLNDRSIFEDAAGRLLGNFKGQALPSDDQLVEGGVYVVPNAEKGKPLDPVTERAYKMGLTGGDVYAVKGVKHYKDDKGVDRVKVGEIVKLAPNEIYGAMLQQPGFAYGVR